MREEAGRHCVSLGGFLLVVLGTGAIIVTFVAATTMDAVQNDACNQIDSYFQNRVIPDLKTCNCTSPTVAVSVVADPLTGKSCFSLSNAFERRRCFMACVESKQCTNPPTSQMCKSKIASDFAPIGDGMMYRAGNSSYLNSDLKADVTAGAFSTGVLAFCFVSLAAGIPGLLAPVYETAAQPFTARFCTIWYSVVSGLLWGPVTVVAVLYFVLWALFLQSNSVSQWLSQDSVDLGKCDTFFFTREMVTWDEAMGTGLVPTYPVAGLNGGGQNIFTCAYYTGMTRLGSVPFLASALIFSLMSIVLLFASCACCYYKPVKGKQSMTIDQYPEPATTFAQPTAVYTTQIDEKAPLPRYSNVKDGWKDQMQPIPIPGANERYYWHARDLTPPTRTILEPSDQPYVGSWSHTQQDGRMGQII